MFTYFQTAVGAFLLHVATSTFLYGNGKVFGCSSMLYNSVANPTVFNVPVVAGISTTVLAISKLGICNTLFGTYLPTYIQSSSSSLNYVLILSGLLAGVGTNLGSGCTSGHMLCGLSRLSVRSIVATCVFSVTAMLTQFFFQTAPDCVGLSCSQISHPSVHETKLLLTTAAILYTISYFLKSVRFNNSKAVQSAISFFSGSVFALGLMLSGMASPANTLGFLATPFNKQKWNPSLLLVIVFGIVPNLIEFAYYKKQMCCAKPVQATGSAEANDANNNGSPEKTPSACAIFDLPTKTQVDRRLVVGASIFGLAWGLTGICPGPGIVSAVYNGVDGLSWLAAFFVGYQSIKSLGL